MESMSLGQYGVTLITTKSIASSHLSSVRLTNRPMVLEPCSSVCATDLKEGS